MRLLQVVVVVCATTAFAGAPGTFTICAPLPNDTTGCGWVWTCPCPGPNGEQLPCDYHPGEVQLCAGNQFSCQNAPAPNMIAWDCQKLDSGCTSPDDHCTIGQYELAFDGFNVLPDGQPYHTGNSYIGNPWSAQCTKNTQERLECTRHQHCNPKVQCCWELGDPLSIKDDVSVEQIEDARVQTSLGPLTFERFFTSSPYTYSRNGVAKNVPHPFDVKSPPYELHWTHNWNSAVVAKRLFAGLGDDEVLIDDKISVLDTSGMLSEFTRCVGSPCYAGPTPNSSNQDDLLYLEVDRATLLRPSQGRFIYELATRVRRQLLLPGGIPGSELVELYRLSRWEDTVYASGQTARVRAQLTYNNALLTSVDGPDGIRFALNWNNGLLSAVSVEKAGQSQVVATYSGSQTSYGPNGEQGARSHVWDADSGVWTSSENGIQVARHPHNGTLSDFGQGDVELVRRGTTPDAGVSNWTEFIPVVGQTTRGSRQRNYVMSPPVVGDLQPQLLSTTDGCDGVECTGSTTRTFSYYAGDRLQSANNAKGGYSVNTYSETQPLPTGANRVVLTSTAQGATEASGVGALESSTFAYSYGSQGQTPRGWEPLLAEESVPSTISAGQTARHVWRRDPATNQLTAEFRTGWTRSFDPVGRTWSTVSRVVGTFYFSHRKCTDGVADPLGRLSEIHGPCFVADSNATDCPSGTVFPVKQIAYHSASSGLNAGHVESQREWTSVSSPTNCTGTALVTSFGGYDILGNAGTITDANGVTTTRLFENGLLKTSTVDGKTTTYSWDTGRVSAIRHPEGNYDVFCYRQATLGSACSQTLPSTRQLQWRAKAPAADGTGYTEGMAYFYLSDGRLSREEAWDGLRNEKRRERSFEENARGDTVRTTWGSSFSELRRFDADGDLTGVNSSVLAATPTCGTQASSASSGSPTCANLKRDRMGRLESMDVAGATPGSTGRTCLNYDAQGNVAGVRLGCPSDSTSFPGPSCGACTQPLSNYTVDDFGNVVAMTLPHLGADGTGTIKVAGCGSGPDHAASDTGRRSGLSVSRRA